jgi:hypothetical protein
MNIIGQWCSKDGNKGQESRGEDSAARAAHREKA